MLATSHAPGAMEAFSLLVKAKYRRYACAMRSEHERFKHVVTNGSVLGWDACGFGWSRLATSLAHALLAIVVALMLECRQGTRQPVSPCCIA